MNMFVFVALILLAQSNGDCASGFKVDGKCCERDSGTVVNGVMVYNCFDNNTNNDGHSSGGNTFPQGDCPVKKCSDCYDRKTVRSFPKKNGQCEEVAGTRDSLGVCRYEGESHNECDWPRQVCYLGKCRTRSAPETRGPDRNGHGKRGPGTEAPGHRAPGTRGPGTEAPGTRGPGTRAPGHRAPGTRGPGTEAPGTRGPGDNGPGPRTKTEGGPGTRERTPNGPGTEGPGTVAPGTRGPGREAPGTRGPGTRAPGHRAPGTRGPGTVAPGTRGPSTEAPGTRAPGTRGPGTEGPGTEKTHWCSHRHQDFHGVKCTGRWRYRPGTPTCVYCRNNGPECCMLANNN